MKLTKISLLLSVLFVFSFYRSSTLLSGLVNVKNDLLDMLVYKRNYTYDQKIEIIWKNEYRLSKLLKGVMGDKGKVYFVENSTKGQLTPGVVANFIYPVRIVYGPELTSDAYVLVYPNYETYFSCSEMFVLDTDNLIANKIECSDYLSNRTGYDKFIKLFKL